MPDDLDALVALMPFAEQLGVVVVEASADRVVARLVAQTTQIQAVRAGA